jgi:hypothetical protein
MVGSRYQVATADPSNVAKMPAVGVVYSKPTSTTARVRVLGELPGIITGMTIGQPVYVGASGQPNNVAGTIRQEIGFVLSPDVFFVQPSVWSSGAHQTLRQLIHFLDDGIPLQGYVRAKDGTRLPVEDLAWSVGRQNLVGTDQTFKSIAGIYDVVVGVRLPNGDRLGTTIGGVRLQSPYTGVWAGAVTVNAAGEYQGQALQANCIGPFDFEVGMAGRVLEGSGGCSLALVVIDPIDLSFDVTGDVRADAVSGDIGFGVSSWFSVPVGWDGKFTDPDTLSGSFSANLVIVQLGATLEARKLSPYVMP